MSSPNFSMAFQLKLTSGGKAPAMSLCALHMGRLVSRGLFANLRKVEDSLAWTARVDGIGEQGLVVVRPDEAGVAILLQQQEVNMLGSLVVGVSEFMKFRELRRKWMEWNKWSSSSIKNTLESCTRSWTKCEAYVSKCWDHCATKIQKKEAHLSQMQVL